MSVRIYILRSIRWRLLYSWLRMRQWRVHSHSDRDDCCYSNTTHDKQTHKQQHVSCTGDHKSSNDKYNRINISPGLLFRLQLVPSIAWRRMLSNLHDLWLIHLMYTFTNIATDFSNRSRAPKSTYLCRILNTGLDLDTRHSDRHSLPDRLLSVLSIL